jgi:hypothetical protein
MAAFHRLSRRTPGPTSESLPGFDPRKLRGDVFPDDIITHYTFTSEDWEIWETLKEINHDQKMAYNYMEHFINNRGYIESLKKSEWVKGEGNLVKPGALALAAACNFYLESVVELLLEHGVSTDGDERLYASLGLRSPWLNANWIIREAIKRIKAKRPKNIKPASTKEEVSDM